LAELVSIFLKVTAANICEKEQNPKPCGSTHGLNYEGLSFVLQGLSFVFTSFLPSLLLLASWRQNRHCHFFIAMYLMSVIIRPVSRF